MKMFFARKKFIVGGDLQVRPRCEANVTLPFNQVQCFRGFDLVRN
jgi:hypothetical protein